jgi:16S rRNA (cytosine1402-N4)-methyltransferase
MNVGRSEGQPAAGGPAHHIPVLLEEVFSALRVKQGGAYLDGTFGAGGYTRALLASGAQVIAFDRDPEAIAAGQALLAGSNGALRLVQARFGDLGAALGELEIAGLDGIVFDIGVSSMQIDDASRGFSLRQDAPLDMRMEKQGRTAADILAEDDEETIANILFHYGEERASRRIARAIVADRPTTPYVSTLQLAEMIARVAPAKPGELTHPATRSFQALRIAVNDELGELSRGLFAAEATLAAQGRLVVVTFHSLEDRIVKQFFARRSGRGQAASRLLPGEPVPDAPTFLVTPGQPIGPGEKERLDNPRSRSAKLRFGERTAAPALGADAELVKLTSLPPARRRRS